MFQWLKRRQEYERDKLILQNLRYATVQSELGRQLRNDEMAAVFQQMHDETWRIEQKLREGMQLSDGDMHKLFSINRDCRRHHRASPVKKMSGESFDTTVSPNMGWDFEIKELREGRKQGAKTI
jgi:hypothetical protein